MYTVTREYGNDGFRMEKRTEKLLREKESILLKNHQATMALLLSLPNTLLRKQEDDGKRKDCKSMPSCNGSCLKDSGKPWYRGYDTIYIYIYIYISSIIAKCQPKI